MQTKDTPQGRTAAKSAPATTGTAWRELDDRDLRNAASDRGITVNNASRDDLIVALEAYDRDGSQGGDAPAENHPATIEERAVEDEKRRERAQGR
jgi:hypothetical protein